MAEIDTGVSPMGDKPNGDTSRAERILHEGREKVSQVGGAARRKVMEKADSRKSELTERLEQLARSIEEFGQGTSTPEGQIATRVAGYVRRAKDVLDGRSSDEILTTVVSEVRDRPAAIVAGCFAIGFLGARLLKT